ncbi:hypothetical protein CR969_01380 [Candidatus Saccharibacteria bacterium]|nr:MAG: hypothetical protein CR969_01380 [Candidatus Saccharibacteria bacterium]
MSKSTNKTNKINHMTTGLIAGLVVTAGVTAYVFSQVSPDNSKDSPIVRTIPNPDGSKVDNTVAVEALHPTYDSVEQVLGEKDLKFVGKVIISDNGTSVISKVNKYSDETTVNTEYKAKVKTVLKGKNVKDSIVLSFLGGIDGKTRYAVEGIPQLKKGDVVMVFASLGGDGKYYPLSGGTAVAIQKPDGKFELTKYTINKGSTPITEAGLRQSIRSGK